jgi:formylglycine-generating enzyme required for sulfatase activity
MENKHIYVRGLLALSMFLIFLWGGVNIAYSQSRTYTNPQTQRSPNKKYYASLVFGEMSHKVPVYSKITGPEKTIARWVRCQSLYKVQPLSNTTKYYKIFDYDDQYLGYIWVDDFQFEQAPSIPTFEMVHVEGGTFIMGNNEDPKAAPEHSVTISDFDICKFEVSYEQWSRIMGKGNVYYNDIRNLGGNNMPTNIQFSVSWWEAMNYIHILNKLTGKEYRLPTEAEWEYAARGGKLSQGYKYSGSNDVNEVGWYEGNPPQDSYPRRQASGMKKPNELGIYDMSGNLWEFCFDQYAPYNEIAETNPYVRGDKADEMKVLRGGGINHNAEYCSVYKRNEVTSFGSTWINGFRLVLDKGTKFSPVNAADRNNPNARIAKSERNQQGTIDITIKDIIKVYQEGFGYAKRNLYSFGFDDFTYFDGMNRWLKNCSYNQNKTLSFSETGAPCQLGIPDDNYYIVVSFNSIQSYNDLIRQIKELGYDEMGASDDKQITYKKEGAPSIIIEDKHSSQSSWSYFLYVGKQ